MNAQGETNGTMSSTPNNSDRQTHEINTAEISQLMMPDIEAGMAAAASSGSEEHPLVPKSPPHTMHAPVPSGANELVDLFAPSGGTPQTKRLRSESQIEENSTHHASNSNGDFYDRWSTPAPTPASRDHSVRSEENACPSSPGRLSWRKAGSTFNMYPATLIASLKEKIRLQQLDHLPRLVLRNRAFHQSSHKVHIRHNKGASIYKLLRFNWFHVLLRWPTKFSLTLLMAIWTGAILLFAGIYVLYDSTNLSNKCGLGGTEGENIHFAGAFALSLETCTTVGK